jgi:hypothetical protein
MYGLREATHHAIATPLARLGEISLGLPFVNTKFAGLLIILGGFSFSRALGQFLQKKDFTREGIPVFVALRTRHRNLSLRDLKELID